MNYLNKFQEAHGLLPDGIIGRKTAKVMMRVVGIDDPVAYVLPIGQAAHESLGWTAFRENMNYSALSLIDKFKKYQDNPKLAKIHARKPKIIANFVYADKNGNGSERSGDGWKYRGAFALQLTGRANIEPFMISLGKDKNTDPDDLINNYDAYFKSIFFWMKKNDAMDLCTDLSDHCITNLGKLVNRGNYKQSTPIALGNLRRINETMNIAKAMGLA